MYTMYLFASLLSADRPHPLHGMVWGLARRPEGIIIEKNKKIV